MSRRTEDGSSRPHDSTPRESLANPPKPRNAFAPELFAALRRRDRHPATPEADFAGPFRVERQVRRLHGTEEATDRVRWTCSAAGEPGPTLSYEEPDLAFLGAAGLALAERPSRFRFQREAPHEGEARLHLMHDGYPVAVVAPWVPEGCSLPADLTRLANLRAQPQALAHFLMAVPEAVLERAGVQVMRMLAEVEE